MYVCTWMDTWSGTRKACLAYRSGHLIVYALSLLLVCVCARAWSVMAIKYSIADPVL